MGNKLRQFQDTLDIQKKTGYKFNKWLFRGAFLIILVLLAVMWSQESFGLKQHIYQVCSKDAKMNCPNDMFQKCDETLVISWQLQWLKDNRPSMYREAMQEIYAWCDVPYLEPGQSYGTKPSWLVKNFVTIAYSLIVLCLVINHLLYNKDFFKGKGGDNETD